MKTIRLDADQEQWREQESDTAQLIQAIAVYLKPTTLDGDSVYQLLRLTWISSGVGGETPTHWQRLKVPALAALFNTAEEKTDNLVEALDRMNLPFTIAALAARPTGIVNFRGTWRNSSLQWCRRNGGALKEIIRQALAFSSDDNARFRVAAAVQQLPSVPSPNGVLNGSPGVLLSPLLECLDPRGRFPIINGRADVSTVLRKLGLGDSGFASQVQGLIGLIGQYGISDAYMLDVSLEQLATGLKQAPLPTKQPQVSTVRLKSYDDAERTAIIGSATQRYEQRHNRMTKSLQTLLRRFTLDVINSPAGRCDALMRNYDAKGRDLLIEAKPDPDRGSIRIAIGQIFDYRRYLARRGATDTAVLTISRPNDDYFDLLNDLGITAIWFTAEDCKKLDGDGRAWPGVKAAILKSKL